MGLISFVKSAGRKVGLFGGEAAAKAEAAQAAASSLTYRTRSATGS